MVTPSFRGLALACMVPCILLGRAAALHMQPTLATEASLTDLNLLAVAPQTGSLPAAHTHALPSVNDVISSASQPFKRFSTAASEMRKKAAETQDASKRNLTILRKHYQVKLSMLKAEHEELAKANEQLRSDISTVNATNDGLEKQAKGLQRSIDLLHNTFFTLQDRVNVAEGFIGDSLNATRVDDNPSVQVLVSTTSEPTLEYYVLQAWHGLGMDNTTRPPSAGVAVAAAEDLDNFATLLQVSSGDTLHSLLGEEEQSAGPRDPSKMTSLLLSTLEKLSVAEQAARHKLQDQYQRTKAKRVEQNGELSAEKARLRSQLKAVTKRKTDLLAVKKTLTDSNNVLREKLGEFVGFLSYLDKAACSAVGIVAGQAGATANT